MIRILRLFALAAALIALNAQAKNVDPIGNFENQSATNASGQPATVQQIKAALSNGGGPRGWTFKEVGPGQLVGSLNVRNKHQVMVDIAVTPGMFSIKYKDSANMNYDGAMINPHYNKWLKILADDARKELAKP
ncbi:hypothetical protein LZ009_18005 [Ramlibacter sp. XY19]|uniref:hypothetical protein n=1 Tax=Ramlibacter paludis TaxID=2908000 RepID=UPI0023DC21D4|nr:hypothetical protein [Ramlibacter paludis]MCG2594676.1 hypothetical protein [Ramlibacter paludis]